MAGNIAIPSVDGPSKFESILLEPYKYLSETPGKSIRSQMMEAFNQWLKVPEEKLSVIKQVVEMLHNASLIIDDIEDNSKLRRGVPVAHQIYGIPWSINCANYVYFLALEKLLTLNNPGVMTVFTEELCNLHRGQGMDLWWRDTNTCPTEEEYLGMINYKTGGLLRLAVKLMQAFSESKADYVALVNILGIHFQIRDDYINLQSSEYMKQKGYCEDVTEGKFSLPIIHSIRTSNNGQLKNILKQRPTEPEILSYAVQCIRNTGSFEYTLDLLTRIEAQARAEIAKLGGNPAITKVLDYLSAVYNQNGSAQKK